VQRWFVVATAIGGCHADPAPSTVAPSSPARPVATAPAPPVAPATPPAHEPTKWSCEQQPFAASSPVGEASAAAWFPIDGKPMLVVTSDSGNDGQYAILDPDSGETKELAKWPLGDASDDVEGLATRGTRLYGLTSGGWMRAWERDDRAKTWKLVEGPYPIAEPGGEFVCKAKKGNCKRDYEGLCMPAGAPTGPCTGFVLSRTDGALYCLAEDATTHRFVVREDVKMRVGGGLPKSMADCAFDDADHLYVAGNAIDLSRVYRISGWQDLATAKPVLVGALEVGFPEVVAVRGDTVYRMSDTGGSPSALAKFRCTPDER
jgi:hypothetical protein